jgi:hypothetical protein
MWDWTQLTTTSNIVAAAPSTTGFSAEWIMERPTYANSSIIYDLADFGTATLDGWAYNGFNKETMYNPDGTFAGPANKAPRGFKAATATNFTMTGTAGNVLASAIYPTNDGITFTWKGYH